LLYVNLFAGGNLCQSVIFFSFTKFDLVLFAVIRLLYKVIKTRKDIYIVKDYSGRKSSRLIMKTIFMLDSATIRFDNHIYTCYDVCGLSGDTPRGR